MVESDRLDDYRKLRPRYQLNMIGRNRVGEPATDLTFVLPDGGRSSLYAVGAEFTILCFVDPDVRSAARCAERWPGSGW